MIDQVIALQLIGSILFIDFVEYFHIKWKFTENVKQKHFLQFISILVTDRNGFEGVYDVVNS